MSSASRASLRRRYRTSRRALSVRDQHLHAQAVARRFAVSGLMNCFKRFAVYAPSDGELDPSPIAQRLLAANKITTLPVVERSRLLSFYRYSSSTPIVRNRFDIPEPDTRHAVLVPTAILDVVLMPLVAFDDAGARLGRGGGFYDATFAGRPHALRVGLAHELQHHPDLTHQPWDVPLDAVITERAARGFTIRGRRFFPGNTVNTGTH
jgi:5-formyltetrahydrofolate cyclo-ligase